MPSSFVLVYHCSPFNEVIEADGTRQWRDQKSPNGIIPTLRNLFRSHPSGTWAEATDSPLEDTRTARELLVP